MNEKNNYFGNTCVCIARVSTTRQDYEAQINALHKRAEQFGYTVIKDIETKESGFMSFDKKEGFNELVYFLQQNNCRIVMCTELSRLSRKKFLLEKIKQWFIDNKIQLWVDDLSFKLFDEETQVVQMATEMVFSMFAAMAESEMKEKFKRLKRGRSELVKEGYSIGGKTCFGYERIKAAVRVHGRLRSKMEIKEEEAKQIRTVYDWYLNGIDGDMTRCSISQIQTECIARGFAKYFHSKRNVNKALKYEPYTGELVKTEHKQKNPEYWNYGNSEAPKYLLASSEMRLPAIIERKTFDAVQKKMKQADPKYKEDTTSPGGFADKSRKHFSLLSKLIICPKCGRFFCGEYRIKKNSRGIAVHYRCLNHHPHGVSELSMRYLDLAAWAFCKEQQLKYIEYYEQYHDAINEKEAERRIENFKKKKDETKNKLDQMTYRFLIVKDIVSTETEAIQIYIKEAAKLKEEVSKYDELIKKEQENLQYRLEAIEKAKANGNYLSEIYGNKYEMRKFIQHVLEAIYPEYHDSDYYVLKLALKDGYQPYTLDPYDHQANGLPYNNYLIVFKRDNLRPKFRLISANCTFDVDKKIFFLPDSATGTLEQVFSDEDEVYFKEIEYKPMDIYNDDAPGGKEIIELKRPIPAPPPPRWGSKKNAIEDTPN